MAGCWLELARLLADPVFYGVNVPRGDGRPVVLMPGFLAGDQTLSVLAVWLRQVEYRPYLRGFVTNTGCSDRTLDRVERRVEGLCEAHGRRYQKLDIASRKQLAAALDRSD